MLGLLFLIVFRYDKVCFPNNTKNSIPPLADNYPTDNSPFLVLLGYFTGEFMGKIINFE